jgi:hypothetical protein
MSPCKLVTLMQGSTSNRTAMSSTAEEAKVWRPDILSSQHPLVGKGEGMRLGSHLAEM